MSEEQKEYKYDVALSFAKEDRFYAQSLANALEGRGIKVFYDKNETAQLLGGDLLTCLHRVFKDEARYCVVFLSQHYRESKWAMYELKAAKSREFKEGKSEYILPIRLDKTTIPEIEETRAYLWWDEYPVDSIANLIIDKLGKQSTLSKFFWDYKFEPEPGRRHWYQLDDQRWIEQYPDGHTSTFDVVDRIVKNNVEGVLVRKVDGDYEKTLVPDDAMQIFIPDRESGERRLYFRHKSNREWQDWKYAGAITY